MEPSKTTLRLDEQRGLETLRSFLANKQQSADSTNIDCKYKDFTFNIDLTKVKRDKDGAIIKTIISNPRDLKFNGQPCNAIEEDGKNTITIINDGEELRFENFTFTKQPCNSDNKTILDSVVETGATELFGNDSFDIKTTNPTTYNIKQLRYNRYNTFVHSA